MRVSEFIEKAATYRNLLTGCLTSGAGTIVTAASANASEVAANQPPPSGASLLEIIAVTATALAGVSTAGLAALRGIIEWRRAAREERNAEEKARRKKPEASETD